MLALVAENIAEISNPSKEGGEVDIRPASHSIYRAEREDKANRNSNLTGSFTHLACTAPDTGVQLNICAEDKYQL